MTRKELSGLINSARQLSGLTTPEIAKLTGLLPAQTKPIDTGSINFPMRHCMSFLHAINAVLVIGDVTVVDYESLKELIKCNENCNDNISVDSLIDFVTSCNLPVEIHKRTNRNELSNMLKQFREKQNVSLTQMFRVVGFQPQQTKRMEKSESNYGMINVFKYLEGLQGQLVIHSYQEKPDLFVTNHEQLVDWLKSNRLERKLSPHALTLQIEIANSIINGIERGSNNLTADVFVKLLDAFDCYVSVTSISNQ